MHLHPPFFCSRDRLPGFNTLALFRVPIRHTVSCVAPFAGGQRFAIAGWFRDA